MFALKEEPARPRERTRSGLHPALVNGLSTEDVPLEAPPVGPLPVGPVPAGQAAVPAAVLPYAGGVPERRLEVDPDFASPARDLWVPASLVAVAVALYAASHLHGGGTVRGAVLVGGAYAVVKAGVTSVAVPLAVWLFGASFGRYAQALLKLAAVALLPDALVVAAFEYGGFWTRFLLGPVVGFLAGWAMFRLLFEMELDEAAWCVLLFAVVGFMPLVMWIRLFEAILGVAY
ncbi:MAG: hypothetical protein JWO31_3165 [Phycisphaerales bacterium]|nr:hypothetical protein [Phycisphaerales bacterium]